MRLKNVENGHPLPQKLMFGMFRLVMGARAPDVIRTLTYRPELFSKHYGAWIQPVMRGPSDWSVGERELFAAFTSKKNQCPF